MVAVATCLKRQTIPNNLSWYVLMKIHMDIKNMETTSPNSKALLQIINFKK